MDHYSFSAGMYMPEYGKSSERKLEKIFFKILFRSPATGVRSDFNGLDLFTVRDTILNLWSILDGMDK
jgi:hypothetical protein